MEFNIFEWIPKLVWTNFGIILGMGTFTFNVINFIKNHKDKAVNLKEKIRERIREQKHTTLECFKDFFTKVDEDTYKSIVFQSKALSLRFLAIDSSCQLLDIITTKLINNSKRIFRKNTKLLLLQLSDSNVQFREERKKYKIEIEKYKIEIKKYTIEMTRLQQNHEPELFQKLLQNEPKFKSLFDKLLQVSSDFFHFTNILDTARTTTENIIKKENCEDLSLEIFSSFQVIEKTLACLDS